MSDSDTSRFERESLSSLVESMVAAGNSELFLLHHTIERIRHSDNELAEAIQYCAIPRIFDELVIGVLREAPDDRETNERLLSGLLSFSFVSSRKTGGYVYHDNVRNVLLEDWRAEDEKRASLDQFNQRLVAFYESRHEKALEVEADLEAVENVMREANPSRLVHLASVVERWVITPLLEALYHETLRSPQSGYDLFTKHYEKYESIGRLSVCESLLNAARSSMVLLASGSEQESLLRWLDYWEARLMLERLQYDESKKKLRRLLENIETEEDTTRHNAQLKLWVLNDLGRILRQRLDLREALKIYRAALELARETPEDQHNLPLYHSQLADVYWSLDELDQAANSYREAIQAARDRYPQRELLARMDLSSVLQNRGEWAEAFDVALEALHVARTRLSSDRPTYHAILARFMVLLAPRAPRLLDTLFEESDTLRTALYNPSQVLYSHLQYVDLLQDSGQLERAENVLEKLHSDAANYADTDFDLSMLFSQASLHEGHGRLGEAIELYKQILERIQDGQGTLWDHARALSNRGLHYVERSLLAKAKHDLQAALVKWKEIGNEKLVALLQLFQASMLRRQGRLAESQRLLDETLPSLEGTNSTHLASYHRVQGEAYRDQARWSEARLQYERELTIRLSLDETQLAARTLLELANVAHAQGQWEKAEQYTEQAQALWLRLSDSAQYRPSEEANRADRDNARGTKYLFTIEIDRRERISRARELFYSATEQDPDNFWYLLNLAYACAELQEWGEAAQAVQAALERGPEWMQHSSILYEQLAEYSFRQADALFKSGDYKQAERIYADSLHRYESRVRHERLAAGWLGWGDGLLTLGEADEAKTKYSAGLSAAANAENVIDQAAFHGRLACASAFQADLPDVLEHSRRSLQLRTQAGRDGGASDLVREWFPFLSSTQQHRTLSEGLRVLTEDGALEDGQRRDLISARLELSKFPSTERFAEIDSAEMAPIATPIILEADNRFFPQDEGTPEVIRMIETDIPLMRDRLNSNTGVLVPGVRIRGNKDFPVGHYVLMLHEIPLAGGIAPLGWKYCPDAAGCRSLQIEGSVAINPRDGTEGMWLSESFWDHAERAELPLLDSYQYMLSHLEVFIRQHLMSFLGFQEVQDRLDRWRWETGDGEDRDALIEAALPDDAARRRLVKVLQELVKEEVPVRDLTGILKTFSEANLRYREVTEVIENIRLVLRPELPGNEDGRQLVGLSPEFEGAISRWVWEQDDNRFLALPPEQAQGLLSAVRERMAGGDTRNLTLIVREPSLRPFVRRLVESIFSTLPVIAERELTRERISVSEQIEYNSQLSATDD